MRVPVAVAQVPVCWSVRRNVGTVLDAISAVGPGTVLVLPECALSGYDDQLSGLEARDGYLSQQRADLVAVTYRGSAG